MSNKERRQLVRGLSDEEYLDTMAVCAMFPHVDMNADVKGEAMPGGPRSSANNFPLSFPSFPFPPPSLPPSLPLSSLSLPPPLPPSLFPLSLSLPPSLLPSFSLSYKLSMMTTTIRLQLVLLSR